MHANNLSIATTVVTVNGQTAYRKGEYFRQQVAVNNTSSALWTNITVSESGNSVTGNVFMPKTKEQFYYDLDGNQTNDGHWTYTWDAENRLIQMTANTSAGPQYQLAFAYDAKGRRIEKIVATNGVAISTNLFLYDGWNLIAELGPNDSLIRSYVWGTDLSGSQQGAGGVGGLLEITYYDFPTTNCFAAYDGNGNVAALVNAADGTTIANYEYGPFGELLRATGPMAKANPFRFSTKHQDDESDLLYYGYRYYNPSTGRWLSRDPIGEMGGKNAYIICRNNPVVSFDNFGLFPFCNHCEKLNEVKLIKGEWEIGTPDKTAKQIEDLATSLHIVENLETGTAILEIIEGNPSILFPKPDITDQGLINNLLAFRPVKLFGRIKYKVCSNVGPRFFFFGSDQLDWIEKTQGWDPSDKNTYDSGQDAIDDVQRFMDDMLVKIKEQYPDCP